MVAISICPPGLLWRIALSSRLAISRSSSRGSPVVGAGRRCANVEIQRCELRFASHESFGRERRQVEILAAFDPGLPAREREQPVD